MEKNHNDMLERNRRIRSRVGGNYSRRDKNNRKNIKKADSIIRVLQLQLIACGLILTVMISIKVANENVYKTVTTGNFGDAGEKNSIEKFNEKIEEISSGNRILSFIFGINNVSSEPDARDQYSDTSSEGTGSSSVPVTSSSAETDAEQNGTELPAASDVQTFLNGNMSDVLLDIDLGMDYEFTEIDDVLLNSVNIPKHSSVFYEFPDVATAPLEEAYLTDCFGIREDPFSGKLSFHTGLDLGAPRGTPVYSMLKGTVTKSAYDDVSGHYIVIQHDDGFASVYCHLNERFAEVGDEVENGEVIGEVGSSGASTGPHLHFNIKKDGMYLDPANYFPYLPK